MSKSVLSFADDQNLYINGLKGILKTFKHNNEFQQNEKIKNNIQKSAVLHYTNEKLTEKKILKIIIFHINLKKSGKTKASM